MTSKSTNPPILDTGHKALPLVLIDTTLLQDGQSYTLSPTSTLMTSLVQPTDNIVVKRVKSTANGTDVSLSVDVAGYQQVLTVHDIPKNYSVTLGIQQLEGLTTSNNFGFYYSNDKAKIYSRFYIALVNNFGHIVNNFVTDYYFKNGMKITVSLPNHGVNNPVLHTRVKDSMKVVQIMDPVSEGVYSGIVYNPYEFDIASTSTSSDNSSNVWWIVLVSIVGLIIVVAILYWLVTSYKKNKAESNYQDYQYNMNFLPQNGRINSYL